MKPFNLEQALTGAPVVTRDGQHVRILGIPPEMNTIQTKQRIVGIVVDKDKRWWIQTWRIDGGYYDDIATNGESRLDLFMADVKKKLYCVLYKFPNSQPSIAIRNSDAERVQFIHYFKELHHDLQILEEFEKEYEE